MKRFFATLLVVVMLMSMIPASTLAATQYAAVVGGWLRLRAAASFEADTITSYYTDTVVEILGTSGSWYHVRTPDGRTGYMYGDYLKLGVSNQTGTANAYVTSHNGYGVRLRKGPGTGYRVIHTYAVGTPVTVLERGTYWSRININGTIGYMMTQFLNFGTSNNGNGNETALCYATIWSSNGYGVRLRTGPGKNYSKIGVYSVGTSVAVLEKGATWDRIRVGSRTGWMMNEFLIYQNANEVTSVSLNTLHPTVGTVLKVKAMSPSSATVSYEWYVNGMLKGTSSTYTVSAADVDKSIQLKVSGTGAYSGSAWSAQTGKVISNTQISGLKLSTTAPVVNDVIKATITPADATVDYAWKVGGYQVSTNPDYAVTANDVGKTIELIVTGKGNYSGMLSASTSAVAATSAITSVAIRNESNATVGAAPMVGDQLTAVVTPAQATATYQWYRSGTAISGANGTSYTLTEADLDSQMSVTVKGNGSYTGEKSASITDAVAARPVQPVIDDYALPEAMVGKTYATQLTAQGGGQLTWSISSGSLPDGLTLSETGAITGTPAKDGTYTFVVKAANAAGSDEKTFAITVVPVAKPQLTIGSVTLPGVTEGYEQPAPVAMSISNVGTADAVLQRLWTEGTNGDCFIVNENGSGTIKAGETNTTWTVQPKAGLEAGTYTANFVVSYDGGSASAVVSFTVNEKVETPVTPTTYTVTMINGAAEKTSYQDGETVKITAATLPDQTFVGWTAEGVVFDNATAAETHFVMPAANVTVTANYTPTTSSLKTYTLTVVGGTSDKVSGQAGEVVSITAGTADEGYTFAGWTSTVAGVLENANSASTKLTMPASDVTVTATYTPISTSPEMYTLTVVGGTADKASYQAGEIATITADPVDESFAFINWTTTEMEILASATESTTTLTMPANNVTVTANFEQKKPELKVKSVAMSTVVEGYVQPAPYTVEITNVGNGNANLTALYPSSGNADAFVVNTRGSSTIKAGETDISWTIQPVSGLQPGQYTTDFVVDYNGVSARANVTFTVEALPTYQLTVVHGKTSGKYKANEEITLVADDPATGKRFIGWTVSDGYSVASPDSATTKFTMPSCDVTVTAEYETIQLAKPSGFTWAEDGSKVSWNSVANAENYVIYRVKANGDRHAEVTVSDPSYSFISYSEKGDVIFVKAIDTDGIYLDSEFVENTF